MSIKLYDLARMTTATTGTGTVTLGVAASLNGIPFLTFSDAGVQDGDIVRYGISDVNGREVGYGTYTAAGTTLTRTVTSSTNGGAAVDLSGSAQVFITPAAADLSIFASAFQVVSVSTDTVLTSENNAQQVVATASLILTFPQISTLDLGWQVWVYAENGVVTLTPNATDAFYGKATAASMILPSGTVARITADGTTTWITQVTPSNQSTRAPGGYLTLVTGQPVIRTDVSAATSVYYTADVHGYVPLFDGSIWLDYPLSGDLTLTLDTASHVANAAYDVFIKSVAGVPTIMTGPAWRNPGNTAQMTAASNASPIVISATGHGLQDGDVVHVSDVLGNTAANGTWTVTSAASGSFALSGSTGNGTYTSGTGQFSSRGDGAGTTQLARLGGIYTNAVAMTAYNGTTPFSVAANQATFVGSILIDSSAGQVTCHRSWGQSRKWGVWNAYNRKNIVLQSGDSTTSWTSPTGWRASNGNSANSVQTFTGLFDGCTSVDFVQNMGSNNRWVLIGIGVSSTSSAHGTTAGHVPANGFVGRTNELSVHNFMSGSGAQNIYSIEYGSGDSNAVYYGTSSFMTMRVSYKG